MGEKVKVYCDGECLYINGNYVTDCCNSLGMITESILCSLGIDFDYVDEIDE